MEKLTIAIPTFERSAFLEALLSSILNELEKMSSLEKEYVVIIVSDNSISEESCTKNLSLVNSFFNIYSNIYYRKNYYNVGASMNVMKCMEYAEDGWVWIIGDDDLILPNSLSHILKLISTYPAFGSISFCSCAEARNAPQKIESYPEQVICDNVPNFLDTVFFNNAGFVSCNVYNCKYFSNFSDIIYEWLGTSFPHLVYNLLCLDSGIESLVTNLVFIVNKPPTWDRDVVESRLYLFKHIPFRKSSSVMSLEKFIYAMTPSIRSKIYFLYRLFLSDSDENMTRSIYTGKFIYPRTDADLMFKLFALMKAIRLKLR